MTASEIEAWRKKCQDAIRNGKEDEAKRKLDALKAQIKKAIDEGRYGEALKEIDSAQATGLAKSATEEFRKTINNKQLPKLTIEPVFEGREVKEGVITVRDGQGVIELESFVNNPVPLQIKKPGQKVGPFVVKSVIDGIYSEQPFAAISVNWGDEPKRFTLPLKRPARPEVVSCPICGNHVRTEFLHLMRI